MPTDREGQKQLHVWIAEELKAELETWRDDHETTYTEIVTQALRRHFEVGHEVYIEARLDRIEKKLDSLVQTSDETTKDDQPDTELFDAPTKPTKTVQNKEELKARRREIRRKSDSDD